jgi:hypothetical protein
VIVEDDIWEIIEKLKLQGFNFLNSGLLDRDSSKKIFSQLDRNKDGKIKIDDFLDYVHEKTRDQSDFQLFYDHIMEELVSLSEKIISKLKKLKSKAFLANDLDALDDIDW